MTDIRHVPPEDIVAWLRAMRTTFLVDPSANLTEPLLAWWRSVWDPDRTLGAYDEGRVVANLRTFPTRLTVPSGGAAACPQVPTDALTQVGVAATHRRRGILTAMMAESLRSARDRGEVVSVLLAAEWPIYGRFGYWPATQYSDYVVSTVGHPAVLPPIEGCTVAQVEPADLLAPARDVHRRSRLQRPGQIERSDAMWPRQLGLDGLRPAGTAEPVCVVARNAAGEVDGFAMWTPRAGDWFAEHQDADLNDFAAATPDAYRALWAYLMGIDLIRSIHLSEQAIDEPLRWLLADGRAARCTLTADSLWLRILDLPAALAARRYAVTDRLVLDVVDADLGGYAAGRVTLDGGPSHADCRATPSATPDLRLSQRALAALYLGGFTVASQQWAGLVDEHTAGAAARLQAMMAVDVPPWNATPF